MKDILQKLTKSLKVELANLSTAKVPPPPPAKKKKTEAKSKGVLETLMQELMKVGSICAVLNTFKLN